MKKGNLVIVATALFLNAALCACGGKAIDPNALTIMGKASDLQKTYMTRIFDLYRETTGEKLNIIAIEDSAYETTALEKFSKGEYPDIFLHFNNADLQRFDVAANCYYLDGETWVDDLTDGAYQYCLDAEGRLLGLPFWESSVSGCYYNKTLLDEMSLRASTTQEDFDGLCAALKEVGKNAICWPGNGCSWMYQFGLDPVFADDPDLLEKLNSNQTTYAQIPAVKDMMQWIYDAENKGWFGNNSLEVGWDQIGEQLSSGRSVMTFIWDTWFYTDFKPGKYTVDDFALMPVFLNTAPEGTYEGGNLNMMMVYKNSEKRQKALDFLAFCAEPENYNVAFDGISTVNCFKGQTTNIQSKMVTDARDSIDRHERVSTAATKIIGYSADDIALLVNDLFREKLTIAELVTRMDEDRKRIAKGEGVAGF